MLVRVAVILLFVTAILYGVISYLAHPDTIDEVRVVWMRSLIAGGGIYSDTVERGSADAVQAAVDDSSYLLKLDVKLEGGTVVTDYENSLSLESLLPLTTNGKCGVIFEITGGGADAAQALCELLTKAQYTGNVAVQSSDLSALEWLKDNRPYVIRGLVTGKLENADMNGFTKFLHRNMLLNYRCRPDYVVFDSKSMPTVAANAIRKQIYVLAGDVADIDEITRLSGKVDGYILEDFAFAN